MTFYVTECMLIIILFSLDPHNLPSLYEIVKPIVFNEQGRIKRDFSTKENKVLSEPAFTCSLEQDVKYVQS